MKDYNKTKRLLNYCHKTQKCDIGITVLQETHLTEDEAKKIQYMWKGNYIMSPAEESARGTIMLYAPWHFEKIIHTEGESNGRMTWLIGEARERVHMFIGIYAPNTKQDEFFKIVTQKAEKLANKQVTEITMCGDFNIELINNPERRATQNEKKAMKTIRKFMKGHDIKIASNTKEHTWSTKSKKSTLDYIITSILLLWEASTKWGVDKLDHALVTATATTNSNH